MHLTALALLFALARPWIGVALDKADRGVRVSEILEGPAKRAGVAVGDQILAVDDKVVRAPDQVVAAVGSRPVGARLTLRVLRGGKELALPVVTEERPDLEQQRRRMLVGKPAPEVELAASVGAWPARLTRLRGQVVLLDFWASWCMPCMMSAPQLSALQQKHGARGLRVVGVTSDDWQRAQKAARTAGMAYTIAHDSDEKVTTRYGVFAVPTYVLIGRDGTVRQYWSGHLDEAEIEKALQ